MREIKIYTGVGGYELVQEAFENHVGLERVYIGKKVPRIIRREGVIIKKSLTGVWYRLRGFKNKFGK